MKNIPNILYLWLKVWIKNKFIAIHYLTQLLIITINYKYINRKKTPKSMSKWKLKINSQKISIINDLCPFNNKINKMFNLIEKKQNNFLAIHKNVFLFDFFLIT